MADKANGVQVFAYIEPETFNCCSAETRAEFPEDARTFEIPVVLASDYEQLQAKLEAAERDAARMNWLSTLGHESWQNSGEWIVHSNLTKWSHAGDTLRDAVDRAMKHEADAAIDAQRQEGKHG